MANECPPLSSHSSSFPVWTGTNVMEVLPDTFSRTVGTRVTLSCFQDLVLIGDSNFTCDSNLQWNYTTMPKCVVPENKPGLDKDTKTIIGIVCGIAGLVVIALVTIMIAVWYRDRKRRQREEKEYGRDRNFYSDMNLDEYRRGLPPSYVSDGRISARSYTGRSRLSAPMYLPGRETQREVWDQQPNYKDYYSHIKKSRREAEDSYSDFEKRPYTRDWVARSQRDTADDYYDTADAYYDRPSVHGRYLNRDTHAWRS